MDFNKNAHSKVKYDIAKIIKKKLGKAVFGDGGSRNMIILMDNTVLKVIPNKTKDKLMTIKEDNDQVEIIFYKFLTNNFIIPNKTPHIVGYYSNYKFYSINKVLPKKCPTLDEMLFVHPTKINRADKYLCDLKKDIKVKKLSRTFDVVVVELCPTTISKEIINIINGVGDRFSLFREFLHRTIFQVIFTLAVIQDRCPNFIHNDLFLRNILATNETKYAANAYVKYVYEGESYYLPANGIYVKINDFGYSLNVPHIQSSIVPFIKNNRMRSMQIKDTKRDVYTFLYDYYNGTNHGSQSVAKILEMTQADNFKKIYEDVFREYIDTKVIKKIIKINKRNLDRAWNIEEIDTLRDTICEPHEYFSEGTFDRYKKFDPENMIVVKTFNAE